jgi:hypothetical protein
MTAAQPEPWLWALINNNNNNNTAGFFNVLSVFGGISIHVYMYSTCTCTYTHDETTARS